MKRGAPLERRTPLAAKRWGVKKDPVETKRRRARDRGEYADPEHLRIVRLMPCHATTHGISGCGGRVDPHHAGEGLACPDPELRKTCDRTAIPLCRKHHRAIECFEGHFKAWDKSWRAAVMRIWIVEVRLYVNARRAA